MTRRHVVAVASALLCALILGLAAAPATAGKRQRTTAAIEIASFNVKHSLSASEAVANIARLSAEVDVIGLQEMSGLERRKAVLTALQDCETCKMQGVFFSEQAMIGAVPILFRKDRFDLYDSGSLMLSDKTYVGETGAGPSTVPPKYANWVKLQEKRTGRFFYVINSHAVASVQGSDGGAGDNKVRLALYRQHMTGLKSLVSKFEASATSIFVVGDLNVNYRRDRVVRDPLFPYVQLGAVSLKANYAALGEPTEGTHAGGRLIDYVYFFPRQVFEPVSQKLHFGYTSDHRPISATFNVRGPGPDYVSEPIPRW